MSQNRFNSAVIDLRFDQPEDYTSSGVLVNSFSNVKLSVDRAFATGFDTITIATNTPINVKTGLIDLFAEEDPTPNKDKSLPRDFWKVVDYAKSLGLKVIIQANIVDHINDNFVLSVSQLGPGVTSSMVVGSAAGYLRQIASRAEQSGVDGMYVGTYQIDFDNEPNRMDWLSLVEGIRSVFTGKLIYKSDYRDTSLVWDLVDIVAVGFNPLLTNQRIVDVEQLISFYSKAAEPGTSDILGELSRLVDLYGKPLLLDDLSFNAGDTVAGPTLDFFNLALTGTLTPEIKPDYEFQSARVAALFIVMHEAFGADRPSFTFREYMPWMQAQWIDNPGDQVGLAFKQMRDLGFTLDNSPAYENAIRRGLLGVSPATKENTGTAKKDRLVGTDGPDYISGLAGNDSLIGGAGDDFLAGGLGKDTLTGGAGADVFVFDAALVKNIDRVTDFNAGEGDLIRLDDGVFTRFAGVQITVSNLVVASGKSAKALDGDDFLIFDRSKGALFYDADGSGKGKPVQFATLVGVTSLTAADFEVV